MAKNHWNYVGDINLSEGGYFWRIGSADWVECVEIIPDSGLNGADNVFHVIGGSMHISDDPAKRKQVLDCTGFKGDVTSADWPELVDAFHAYYGIERDSVTTVRIGKIDPLTNPMSAFANENDVFHLRANHKLKNYVKKNFLQ